VTGLNILSILKIIITFSGMNARMLTAFFLPLLASCSTDHGDYRCAKLVSNKQETLYMKTHTWGINADN
jgi:hypothetical protein